MSLFVCLCFFTGAKLKTSVKTYKFNKNKRKWPYLKKNNQKRKCKNADALPMKRSWVYGLHRPPSAHERTFSVCHRVVQLTHCKPHKINGKPSCQSQRAHKPQNENFQQIGPLARFLSWVVTRNKTNPRSPQRQRCLRCPARCLARCPAVFAMLVDLRQRQEGDAPTHHTSSNTQFAHINDYFLCLAVEYLSCDVVSRVVGTIWAPECFFGGFHPFLGPHIGPDCGTNGVLRLV